MKHSDISPHKVFRSQILTHEMPIMHTHFRLLRVFLKQSKFSDTETSTPLVGLQPTSSRLHGECFNYWAKGMNHLPTIWLGLFLHNLNTISIIFPNSNATQYFSVVHFGWLSKTNHFIFQNVDLVQYWQVTHLLSICNNNTRCVWENHNNALMKSYKCNKYMIHRISGMT